MEKTLETQLLSSTKPTAVFQSSELISSQMQQTPGASAKPVERYAPICSDHTLKTVFRSTWVMEEALERQLLSSTEPPAVFQSPELIPSQG